MATLSDIAKEAHCSVNLVAYVLHKQTPVTKERHKEILRIAQEMNYVSNRVASALVTGRTNNLALIIGSNYYATLSSPFFSEVLYELTSQLTMEGIGLTLYAAGEPSQTVDRIILDGMCDGIMWYMGGPTPEMQQLLKARGLPGLCLYLPGDCRAELDDNIGFLAIDDYSSEYELMRYLYDHQHRRILFVGGDSPRYRAYCDFCTEYGLPLMPPLRADGGADFKNRTFLREYIETNGRDFTAMVCCTDEVAISMLYVLNSMGISVPEDVSVVGYDDLPAASRCSPALTTVCQNHKEIVQQAKKFFLQRIHHGERDYSVREVYTQRIVERDSVADLASK